MPRDEQHILFYITETHLIRTYIFEVVLDWILMRPMIMINNIEIDLYQKNKKIVKLCN